MRTRAMARRARGRFRAAAFAAIAVYRMGAGRGDVEDWRVGEMADPEPPVWLRDAWSAGHLEAEETDGRSYWASVLY